jgi:hypothetical protein
LSDKRRFLILPAALLAAIVLLGAEFSCSVGNTVSSEEMNKQVTDSYESETGVNVTSMNCDEVEAEIGEKISCTGSNENDLDFVIGGEVTEVEDSDKINFDWEVVSGTLPGSAYEDAAAETLQNQIGVEVTSMECPDRINLEAGEQVTCRATAANGDEADAIITLTDQDGGFRVRIDDGGSGQNLG